MNITSTTELLILKDKAMLSKSYLSDKRINETIPVNDILYNRSLQDPHTLLVRTNQNKNQNLMGSNNSILSQDSENNNNNNNGLTMNAAIRSLRYALEHPLTNYNEVPAKGFLPPKDYVRPTLSSVNHKLPRIQKEIISNKKNANPTLFDTTIINMQDKEHGNTIIGTNINTIVQNKKKQYISTSTKQMHDNSKLKTLAHLEDVLNNLNSSTTNMLNVKYSNGAINKHNNNNVDNDNNEDNRKEITLAEEQILMKRFAKPNNQIKGLINMINNTADELDL